jgi:saccharopine dehydrogenase-like NADP-dependent oxidoreductase
MAFSGSKITAYYHFIARRFSMGTTIAITGGQGFVGSTVGQLLLAREGVERVILMDRMTTGQIEEAEEIIVDIHNHEELVAALKDVDLVFNAVGPYFAHGTSVFDAALASGTNYADACADVAITKAMLAKDQEWQDAGLTAVTGFGLSPGITNLLAGKNKSQFDEVHKVSMFWWGTPGDDIDIKDIEGTMRGVINEEIGPVPTFEDGKEVTVIGFRDGEEVLDINGYDLSFYHAGHSEQITAPMYFPHLTQAHLKGCLQPSGIAALMAKGVDMGMNTEQKIDVFGVEVDPVQFLMCYAFNEEIWKTQCNMDSLKAPEGAMLRMEGIKDGQNLTIKDGITLGDRANGQAMFMTGMMAAVGCDWLASGRVAKAGAFAPEALDSDTAAGILEDSCVSFTAAGFGDVARIS